MKHLVALVLKGPSKVDNLVVFYRSVSSARGLWGILFCSEFLEGVADEKLPYGRLPTQRLAGNLLLRVGDGVSKQ